MFININEAPLLEQTQKWGRPHLLSRNMWSCDLFSFIQPILQWPSSTLTFSLRSRAAFPVDCWTPCHGCSDDIFNFSLHLKLAHYHFFPPKSFSFLCLLGQYLGEGVLKAGIGVGQFTLGLWCFLGPVFLSQVGLTLFLSTSWILWSFKYVIEFKYYMTLLISSHLGTNLWGCKQTSCIRVPPYSKHLYLFILATCPLESPPINTAHPHCDWVYESMQERDGSVGYSVLVERS